MGEKIIIPSNYNQLIQELTAKDLVVVRVISQSKERYIVQSGERTYNAEVTGNLRFGTLKKSDFPVVGDWVAASIFDDNLAIIHDVLERKTVLERRAVGAYAETQILASNVDVAIIVQSANQDFNLKRLDRYISICHSSKIQPIIAITKVDLLEESDINFIDSQLKNHIGNIRTLFLSIYNKDSLQMLRNFLDSQKTYCFLGSSGVGKSTLVNYLLGKEIQKTNQISENTNKGKHTTSHRELFVMPNGSLIIDVPGIRELGITANEEGIDQTFDQIIELSKGCKFRNCKHINEKDCEVINALEANVISKNSYDSYIKLKREQEHFADSVSQKRAKSKNQGKIYKAIQAERKRRKL
jgi:ribosome biogenesis GTPase